MVKIDPCWENCKSLYVFIIALVWLLLWIWALVSFVQCAIECGWCQRFKDDIIWAGFILFFSVIGFLNALGGFIEWLQGDCGD